MARPCGAVHVVAKSSGDATDATGPGWDEATDGRVRRLDTGHEQLARHRARAPGGTGSPPLIPDQVGHVASGPLVLAMPQPMAKALGWPDAQIGWADVLALAKDPQGWARTGIPEWGKFNLGKTNPNFSTSGLAATIGEY